MLSPVDEIKSRLDLVDIITGYIQVRQAGTNFKAVCPFHQEKSPSFMISREKQIWHCFGCGEGGDLFGFVMKMEGLSFPDALRVLADKAGVKLEKQDPQVYSRRNTLYDVCEMASKFFHELLLKHPKAEIAREYIKKRGLKPETIEKWQLGYSPDSWDVLGNYLRAKGVAPEEIFAAGLTVKKDRGAVAASANERPSYYDRFRNRLMFPINDIHGHVVGFTARVLDEVQDKMGKYINSPQTEIYDKGRMLFGLDKAKTDIRKQNLAVLVEGNMDCISSHEAGVTNVVASSGTALTLPQVTLIKRFTENLALSFDADDAGQNAALKGIEVAQAAGLNIKVVNIPDGKDPDDCIRHSPQDWVKAIQQAQPIMEYYFATALKKYDINKSEDKKNAAKFILTKISKMPEVIEQVHYVQKLAQLINVSERLLMNSLPKTAEPKTDANSPTNSNVQPSTSRSAMKPRNLDRHLALTETFLSLLMHTQKVEFIEQLSSDIIAPGPTQELYKNLETYYNQAKDLKLENVVFWQKWQENLQDNKLINYNNQLSLFLDKEFDPGTDLQKEIKLTISELKKLFLTKKREGIARELQRAESLHDEAKVLELSKFFSQVSGELNKLTAV